jgi:hypothetical protein
MEEVFVRCGIQQKSFFSIVEYNREGFPPLWDTMEEVFSFVGYNREKSQDGYNFFPNTGVFLPLYPTPQQNLMRCTVSHNTTHKNCGIQLRKIFRIVSHNTAGFLPLYPTMEDIFLHCGIQRKRFFSIVGYNGRGFPPLWDTAEDVFSIVGYNGRGFFPLWDTMENC